MAVGFFVGIAVFLVGVLVVGFDVIFAIVGGGVGNFVVLVGILDVGVEGNAAIVSGGVGSSFGFREDTELNVNGFNSEGVSIVGVGNVDAASDNTADGVSVAGFFIGFRVGLDRVLDVRVDAIGAARGDGTNVVNLAVDGAEVGFVIG